MIVFTTFGDSRSCGVTLKRICKEAKHINIFDKIVANNETTLDQDFIQKNYDFISKNPRGFGYWLWKPQVILQALRDMNEGDVLVYADAGCTINPLGRDRLLEYIDMAEPILAFESGNKLTQLTKMDTLKYMYDELDYDKHQISCTVLIVKKCNKSVDIIKEWLDIAMSHNYHHLDDSKSIEPNHSTFYEHRHDQSVFSGLVYKYKLTTIPEEFEGNYKRIIENKFPFAATRMKDFLIFDGFSFIQWW